jgi:hypothetical protein
MLQIRIQMNTNLQQSSWILPVTEFFKPFGIKKDEKVMYNDDDHVFAYAEERS